MRHAACISAFALAVCCTVRAAEDELDKFEEKCIARALERAINESKNERTNWMKELEVVFPGRVESARSEEEYLTWFDLLAGKNEDWQKDDAANPKVAELFAKVVRKLDLGPVPSIKRDEFKRYIKKVLVHYNPPRDAKEPDPNEDADRAFRALDRDQNGELDVDEMTTGVKADKVRIDADGNGRISKDEYRAYFNRKLTARFESHVAKSGETLTAPDGKIIKPKNPGAGLPEWFTTLDTDKDGQVSLHEWITDGRAIDTFKDMDLDGDGLLTRDEYLRYLKQKEVEANQKRREGERP